MDLLLHGPTSHSYGPILLWTYYFMDLLHILMDLFYYGPTTSWTYFTFLWTYSIMDLYLIDLFILHSYGPTTSWTYYSLTGPSTTHMDLHSPTTWTYYSWPYFTFLWTYILWTYSFYILMDLLLHGPTTHSLDLLLLTCSLLSRLASVPWPLLCFAAFQNCF